MSKTNTKELKRVLENQDFSEHEEVGVKKINDNKFTRQEEKQISFQEAYKQVHDIVYQLQDGKMILYAEKVDLDNVVVDSDEKSFYRFYNIMGKFKGKIDIRGNEVIVNFNANIMSMFNSPNIVMVDSYAAEVVLNLTKDKNGKEN